MNAQKFRYVLIGLIVLVVAAGGAVGYYGINLLHEKVNAAQKINVEAEVNNEAGIYAQQAQQRLNDPEIARLSNYLAKVIPENSYQNQFIADVNKYAAESGVPLTSLAYEDSAEDIPAVSGSVAVPIQLQLGENIPYRNFISFAKKLENNLQQVQILSVSLQPQPENRAVLQSASLTVALYVEPSDG